MWRETFHKISSVLLELMASFIFNVSYCLLPITKVCVRKVLNYCGIDVNGNRPFDPKVTDDRFYCELLARGMSGIGFAYQYCYFNCEDLVAFYEKVYTIKNFEVCRYHPYMYLHSFITKNLFVQSDSNCTEQVAKAYEDEDGVMGTSVDTEGYATFSTGYWEHTQDVDQSYIDKFDLVAQKLKLTPGLTVLDVGCGEGTLCKHFAQNYDVNVIGINISRNQIKKARRLCNGLNVQIKETSALNLNGTFDRITCILVAEHIGLAKLRQFFQTMHRCLTDVGLLFLETIILSNSAVLCSDGYTDSLFKAFFPSSAQFFASIDGLFLVEDWQNAANHHYLSCLAEIEKKRRNREQIEKLGGKLLFRQMEASLSFYAALFKNNCYNLSFIVLSKL